MKLQKPAIVKLVVAFLGILTCVDFILALDALARFSPGARNVLRSHVSLMILSVIITGLTVIYTGIELYIETVGPPQGKKRGLLYRLARNFYSSESSHKVIVPGIVLLLNVFALVTTLFSFLNVGFLMWISSDGGGNGLGPTVALKCYESIGLGLQVFFVSGLVVSLWWPYVMLAGCLLTVSSTLQFLITISSVLINFAVVRADRAHFRHKTNQIYICLSLFLAIASFLGFNLVLVVRAHNRLSTHASLLGRYYIVVCCLSAVFCLVWFILSLVELAHDANHPRFQDDLVANPVLAGVGFLLDILCIVSAAKLGMTPQTKLMVKEYDLNSLSADQLKAWAIVIDAYNAQMSVDIPKGENALELMMAYANSPMQGFSCKIMRVYDPKIANDTFKSYENVKVWNQLDIAEPLNDSARDVNSAITLIDNTKAKAKASANGGQDAQPLSKNALKKAQKKAAKKNKPVSIPVATESKSPEELQRENDFRDTIMATEALFLMTSIEDYDLTSPLHDGWARTLLSKTLGGQSWLKPLCVRMGIIGTHWPFRQMMFFTAPTKKPIARGAAILAAVSSWNNLLPRNEKYTIILNPSYANSRTEAAFEMSNWVITKMLPSHVIDLRSYKGKTVKDYLKAIKYRNQATTFNQAHGEVIETSNFSLDNCTSAMSLWHNIADKRTSEGHTAVLHEPNVDFLHSLGGEGHNEKQWRKLLFLKVDGEIIASCVLFILGNTITSDIQGLEHEKARHYKAYFVMMQETISIALRDGISFVDFGPTTSKPKQDIGASQVPILGGIKALSLLSPFVSMFAGQVDG